MLCRFGARCCAMFLLLLAAQGAQAEHWQGKPDMTDSPDLVSGDWIQPADIMFIGDSQGLGFFGAQLYRSLAAERDPKSGHPLKVWALWTCGSDVASWDRGATSYCGIRTCNGAGDCARDHGPLDRPGHVRYAPLRHYLSLVHPRVTIVSLGTNVLTDRETVFRNYTGRYLEEVGTLIDQIASAQSACIWIGPPQTAITTKPVEEYEAFVARFARAARSNGCVYIDSNRLSDRNFVLRSDPEGIHYQGAGEKAWETKVWAELEPALKNQLAH
jgi:hypothetical protein